MKKYHHHTPTARKAHEDAASGDHIKESKTLTPTNLTKKSSDPSESIKGINKQINRHTPSVHQQNPIDYKKDTLLSSQASHTHRSTNPKNQASHLGATRQSLMIIPAGVKPA
ncbi:hypothetical protein [Acidipropionibacterium acidipropionici]|nr:hypothetical protein [Acidipropionibacterium acidipropionici]